MARKQGICGKPTVHGPPCQNPAGCTVSHPPKQAAAPASHASAVAAAAVADTEDTFVPDSSFSRDKYDETWADQYQAAGFDVDDGYAWWSRNFYPGEATDWASHDFTAEDARVWADKGGFWTASAAAPYRDEGLTPGQARGKGLSND